eukprot:m.9930 g.9930  ORF g.9930 m.9930 type:complete len:294 (+) comp8016_c0_seq1:311-1192(+)
MPTTMAGGANGFSAAFKQRVSKDTEEADDEIEAQVTEINHGTHKDLQTIYTKLTQQKQDRMRSAALLKKYREETVKKIFSQEFRFLHGENKKAKAELRKQMISDLETERVKCKEWLDNIKIDAIDADVRETRRLTRAKRRVGGEEPENVEKSKKPKVVRDPSIAGPMVQLEVKAHDLDTDLQMLNDPRMSKKRIQAIQQNAPEPSTVECFYEHKPVIHEKQFSDRLWYEGKWYFRESKITVEYADGTRQTGHVFMFTSAEIWIRRLDLTKFSLRISELVNKKYSMRLAIGREQ